MAAAHTGPEINRPVWAATVFTLTQCYCAILFAHGNHDIPGHQSGTSQTAFSVMKRMALFHPKTPSFMSIGSHYAEYVNLRKNSFYYCRNGGQQNRLMLR